MAAITFFYCTLEEYFLDKLDFPCFHGVSEGTIIAALVCIFTGIFGQDFWLTKIKIFTDEGICLNILFTYLFLFVSLLFTFLR